VSLIGPNMGGQEVYPKWYRYQEIGKAFDYGSEIPPITRNQLKNGVLFSRVSRGAYFYEVDQSPRIRTAEGNFCLDQGELKLHSQWIDFSLLF